MPVDLPKPPPAKPAFMANWPKLVSFLAVHLAFGAAIGVAFASLVIISNVSDIKTLIAESSEPYLALALLYAMNILTFGAMAMGVGVMTLPLDAPCDMRDPHDRDDGEEDKPGG
jgi:hypothetical protein